MLICVLLCNLVLLVRYGNPENAGLERGDFNFLCRAYVRQVIQTVKSEFGIYFNAKTFR